MGGSAVTVSTDADGHATVRYTFGDGSSVVIPMYNAAYRNTTENSGEADGGAAFLLDSSPFLPFSLAVKV